MPEQPSELVEHFFRHESANLVSILARVFGFGQLPLIEDMVQTTLVQALHQWQRSGVPNSPTAWVHRVAKNKILDALRRGQTESRILRRIAESDPSHGQAIASGIESLFDQDSIQDSLLRMMFAICHSTLDRQSQIALTLRLMCGFSNDEVASALLISTDAARKRIYRGKRHMAQLIDPLEIPVGEELADRIGGVHEVLYLMFNEGYNATRGSRAIRDDVCEEACRLCHLLSHHVIGTSATKALLSLMLYQAARFAARVSADGSTVMLEDQDRSQWDQRLIGYADYWLQKSAADTITTFHLEAGICQLHCRAASFQETDWGTIVELYDRLIEVQPTPIYRLNRAVAIGHSGDAKRGIAELKKIASDPRLKQYHLLDCSLAHLHELIGQNEEAVEHLTKALQQCDSEHERELIRRKIAKLTVK